MCRRGHIINYRSYCSVPSTSTELRPADYVVEPQLVITEVPKKAPTAFWMSQNVLGPLWPNNVDFTDFYDDFLDGMGTQKITYWCVGNRIALLVSQVHGGEAVYGHVSDRGILTGDAGKLLHRGFRPV